MNLRLAEIELAHWRQAGKQVRLWWRDDDAREPTPALDRLLAIAHKHEAPLTLAVVPDLKPQRVAERILSLPHVVIAQHGADHVNRSPPGRDLSEMAPDETIDVISARMAQGAARLRGLPSIINLYVPPFNNFDDRLTAALRLNGISAISAWGGQAAREGDLKRVDAHFETLRWGGGARFKGAWKLTTQFAKHLRQRRRAGAWDEPIGFLTHHLDHDEASWAFLDGFLRRTAKDPVFSLIDIRDVLELAPPSARKPAEAPH